MTELHTTVAVLEFKNEHQLWIWLHTLMSDVKKLWLWWKACSLLLLRWELDSRCKYVGYPQRHGRGDWVDVVLDLSG